jgi:hypothetical protein
MHFDQDGWARGFRELGDLWSHDGDPKSPHVRVGNGLHASGYWRGEEIFKCRALLGNACSDLVELLALARFDTMAAILAGVVGPEGSGLKLLDGLRDAFRIATCKEPRRAYTVDVGGRQAFETSSVAAGEYVICADEIFSLGGDLESTIAVCEARGAIVVDFIPVLVNVSPRQEFTTPRYCQVGNKQVEDGIRRRRIVSLVHVPITEWKQEDCPLCAKGSPAVYPIELVRTQTKEEPALVH